MSDASDPYDLRRFVDAQAPVFEQVRAELREGRKRSHWMWFVFPQIAGLGMSAMSRRYAISSLDEARAYLEHPVLGPRLRECTRLVMRVQDPSAEHLLGSIDAQKLRSSMTLFMRAAPDELLFRQVIDQYFGGHTDSATDERIQAL